MRWALDDIGACARKRWRVLGGGVFLVGLLVVNPGYAQVPEVAEPENVDPSEPAPDGLPEGRTLVVLETVAQGLDPVVGQHVTYRVRETGGSLGYQVLSAERASTALERLGIAGRSPTPADLWKATYVAQAHRGVQARVWAREGRYVFEVMVASLDGTGPYFARGDSGAHDLHEVVERLVREALPPSLVWRDRSNEPSAPVGPPETEPISNQPTVGDRLTAPNRNPSARSRPPRPAPPLRRFHLAVQTEAAFGTSQDFFYNHLVGARLDYRISQDVLAGWYTGYANLRGKDGRTNNLLTYLQIEDRVRISADSRVTIPLRLALGYLPFNGPVVRLAAGLNIPIGRRFELGVDLLTPTFWILSDRTAVSLNVAAELIWRL